MPDALRRASSTQPPHVGRAIERAASGAFSEPATNDDRGTEGDLQPSADDQEAAGREGLLGRLHSRISVSLARLSSIEPTLKPFQRRKSSLESVKSIAAKEEGAERAANAAGSPCLDALMPFVPLMFRRDLLLPEPTFSATQVQRLCDCVIYTHTLQ